GKSDLQTLKNVVELEVAAPSTFRPDVSPELDAVVMRALARDPEARCPTGKELVEELDRLLGALHYQPRALPDLLQEVFGSELTSQELPNTTLTAALLAACAAEGSSVVSAGGPTYPAGRQLSPDVDEYSISIGTAAPVRAKPGWMSWAAATIGTVALILLAFARGGGGRSQAASPPYAAAPAPAPTIAPAAAPPVAAPASEPATSPGAGCRSIRSPRPRRAEGDDAPRTLGPRAGRRVGGRPRGAGVGRPERGRAGSPAPLRRGGGAVPRRSLRRRAGQVPGRLRRRSAGWIPDQHRPVPAAAR